MKNLYSKLFKTLLFIFLATIILIILDLCDVTQYVHLSNNYDWLSYFGTVLVGFFTIITALITINQNNVFENNRVKPSFKVLKTNSTSFSSNLTFYNSKCNRNNVDINIKVKIVNDSKNELKNLYLKSVYNKKKFFYNDYDDNGFIASTINSNDSLIVSIFFVMPVCLIKNDVSNVISNVFYFTFNDCLGNNYVQKYVLNLNFDYNLKIKKFKILNQFFKPLGSIVEVDNNFVKKLNKKCGGVTYNDLIEKNMHCW